VPRARRVAPSLVTVPVRRVERSDGPAPVYDFEVPGTHLFATTGGLVTHNCVGVPTVGGTTTFDPAYADNCLVNAMCVGLLPTLRVLGSRAQGPGNLVLLFGATTGGDGIGGASVLASQELGEGAHEKRPSVQVGDPFTGKKLIEASLELVERGLVASLQDCGAAGLASSLAEMARDGAGIDVHLDRVPLREALEPWEIMISESQERMVAVLGETFLGAAEEVLGRWELECAVIGSVTDSGELRCFFDGDELAAIPARLLTDEAPRYTVEQEPRPAEPPPWTSPEPLAARLAAPNGRSRRWIYERYDHLVGSRTVRRPGLDAAILRLRPSMRGLAVSLDGPLVGMRDPWLAGASAVLEAARNVACAGGEPIGLTDCLNFGNPEKADIGFELAEAIEGIAEAAEALGIPVVSGNVSLYNETDGRAIPPTPVVGCVGVVPDVRRVPARWREGDVVLLAAAPAPFDVAAEAALVRFLWKAAPLLSLAHDVDEGDVELALAEAALWSGIGAKVEIPEVSIAGAAVLACAPGDEDRLGARGLTRIGVVGGDGVCGLTLDELREANG
jgi:phosphoribosylformylglycinamidine synthase